ncbi:hypothetical protein HHL19_26955 [Streptomyces sp. R302]|uniref:hypothetical protein n=1 Tax=unclassified Streptomyces TaxID=2593676 RepID=UPI00145C9E38|nr:MULTISPECIES: hypothetical protein [unclassified Streptomyces]NML52340.1 hypothetical protein [Streptomyces sp. R301]NML82194.1 hypothetical protein [Streptomyces sp. R302]
MSDLVGLARARVASPDASGAITHDRGQDAERGNTYRTEEVEVIQLLDGDIEAILPKGMSIDHLEVEVSGGAVTLESRTSDPDASLAEYTGPGMGEGHSTWKRNKLSEDGNGTYDWYQAAATHSFKVKQGTAGSMHDFQRGCSSYDASATC